MQGDFFFFFLFVILRLASSRNQQYQARLSFYKTIVIGIAITIIKRIHIHVKNAEEFSYHIPACYEILNNGTNDYLIGLRQLCMNTSLEELMLFGMKDG